MTKPIAALDLPEKVTFANARACSAKLRETLDHACRIGAVDRVVVVNAAAVKVFDSSALSVLLQLRRDAGELKRALAVQGLSAQLRELSRLYGVDDLLPEP